MVKTLVRKVMTDIQHNVYTLKEVHDEFKVSKPENEFQVTAKSLTQTQTEIKETGKLSSAKIRKIMSNTCLRDEIISEIMLQDIDVEKQ